MHLLAQTDDAVIAIFFIFWIGVFGLLSGIVYQSRGGSFGAGFLLGALLGIIGLLIVAVMKPGASRRTAQDWTRKCPYCLQDIPAAASVCHHCGRESQPWVWKDDRWWVLGESAWHWFDARKGEWVEWRTDPTQELSSD